ncbi:MAG: hypothetical protein LBE62_13005 [Azonexus sp.]|jgi:hypothetical protein|nr:hypothetical protein [Azonexus sp.]
MLTWPPAPPELLALLPPVLKAVVKALGPARAREWLEARGGVNINIPVGHGPAIGLTADELSRLRLTLAPHTDAAGRVSLPKVDKLWQVARNAAIVSAAKAFSIRDQALAYRLTGRQISNIRRGAADSQPGSGGQMDLF